MTKKDLQYYLIDEAEYRDDEVLSMSSIELVNAWLTWNGIIYYTEDILEVVEAAYGIELEDRI